MGAICTCQNDVNPLVLQKNTHLIKRSPKFTDSALSLELNETLTTIEPATPGIAPKLIPIKIVKPIGSAALLTRMREGLNKKLKES